MLWEDAGRSRSKAAENGNLVVADRGHLDAVTALSATAEHATRQVQRGRVAS
jgi:hypothetical protein